MIPANIVAMGAVFPRPEPLPLSLPEGAGCAAVSTFQVTDPPGRDLIAPARLRRLGRAQRIALAAAHGVMAGVSRDGIEPESIAVSVGTGMGELDETVAFLENMISLDEREPRPAKFINSVHNSLAAQIAIEFGLTGENHTFTHGAISFETALRQAIRCMEAGRAEMALACGADALNAYAVAAAGMRYRGRNGTRSDCPSGDRPPSICRGGLSGEGAAAFMLAREGWQGPVLGRVRALACLPVDTIRLDAQRESAFIRRTLDLAGLPLADVQLLLLGANGDPRLDRRYMAVAGALREKHAALSLGTYKGGCGEFCTASALGLALAVRSVSEGRLPEEGIALLGGRSFRGPLSCVLLYHLSLAGYHSLCAVSR